VCVACAADQEYKQPERETVPPILVRESAQGVGESVVRHRQIGIAGGENILQPRTSVVHLEHEEYVTEYIHA